MDVSGFQRAHVIKVARKSNGLLQSGRAGFG